MIKPLNFHLLAALTIFSVGFLFATGGALEKEYERNDWSEVTALQLTAAELDLNYLASSPRWELDLALGEAENSTLDTSDLKLVGVIEGEQLFALLSVGGELGRFVVGDNIDEHEQWIVKSIKEHRVILARGRTDGYSGEQIELLLYSQVDDE